MFRRIVESIKRALVAPCSVVGCAMVLPLFWLCWRYWDYYPLWDAGIYYESTINAAKTTWNPLAYNAAGHPTMGYLWLPGVLTRTVGDSYRVFLVYNAWLGWLMAVAVADIASQLLKTSRRLDLALVVGSVLYCPVIASSVVQLSPDFGVLVFLTLATRALIRGRLARALGWGILGCFSKESGILLFGMTLAIYLVVYVLRSPSLPALKVRAIRRHIPLALALLGGLGVIATIIVDKGSQVLWAQVDILGIVRQFTTVSFMDNLLPASLSTIFVLNCMWIPTLILALWFGFWFVRSVLLALPGRLGTDPVFEFSLAAFLLDLFLLTRFRTFTNVRYYLPVFPWIVLLAARGLWMHGGPRAIRLVGQTAILAALGWSNFRSFDPVSAELFGTMRFGEHRLFRITSLTRECCGLGRDQLVYNLEFAEIDNLLREALPFLLAARGDHAIAVHPEADWKFFDSIDPKTLQRATPRPGSFKVPYTHTWAVGAAVVKPEKIYYLTLPNMPDSHELVRYGAWYRFNWWQRSFEHDGYSIAVHELLLRH